MGKIFDGIIAGTAASVLVAGGVAFTHGSCGYYNSAWKAVKCEDAYNKVVSARLEKKDNMGELVFSNISEEERQLWNEINKLKDEQNGYAKERIAGLTGVGVVCAGLYLASSKLQENDETNQENGDNRQLEDESVLSQNVKIENNEEDLTGDNLEQ